MRVQERDFRSLIYQVAKNKKMLSELLLSKYNRSVLRFFSGKNNTFFSVPTTKQKLFFYKSKISSPFIGNPQPLTSVKRK